MVVRTGSDRSPRSGPASRAKPTGVNGGRNVVGPSASIGCSSSSAITPSVSTPDVRPWSFAVPIVVKRLTCSGERSPAAAARRMSATVASRCWSTKQSSSVRPGGGGTDHSSVAGSAGGATAPFADPAPVAAAPAAAPCATHASWS